MAGLKLQAVTKSWDGKTQVIKPLTLDVADGEFIVMVGPSGCGKSTLLRMVAGLERVTEGDIWIDLTFVAQLYLLHFSLRGITQFHHSILFCERAHTCELSQ